MKFPLYIVDAFTEEQFKGNPAAVCLLPHWIPEPLLQSIATENNLSETAFVVPKGDDHEIRWFTPTDEIDLCGHATLATAQVLFTEKHHGKTSLSFHSGRGRLDVTREGDMYFLDFPATPPRTLREGEPGASALRAVLNVQPVQLLKAREYVAVFETEAEVRNLSPDLAGLAELDALGLIATAPLAPVATGGTIDYVVRCFFPKIGIPEDPVTGAAQCALAPYWSARLDKDELRSFQVSARGGYLLSRHRGERVQIGGHAVRYLAGEITVPDRAA